MIYAKNIVLRDLTESDIKNRIYWEKVETEWQQWDAPWEYEGLSEEEKEAGCLRIALMKTAIISRPFVIISSYSTLFVIHWNKSVS